MQIPGRAETKGHTSIPRLVVDPVPPTSAAIHRYLLNLVPSCIQSTLGFIGFISSSYTRPDSNHTIPKSALYRCPLLQLTAYTIVFLVFRGYICAPTNTNQSVLLSPSVLVYYAALPSSKYTHFFHFIYDR